MAPIRRLPLLLAALLAWAGPSPDEGLWTFSDVPANALKARYGWAPDRAWLDHVRRASVKLPGGSGAFVSREGLILTNQHIARRWIQPLGTPERDLLKEGFVAADRPQEIPLPGLVVQTLEAMEDVTDQVNRASRGIQDEGERLRARRLAFARITAEVQARTRLSCERVTFHQGGQYWIYGYRSHADVRLVMVPEMQAAWFGGDHDNFTFPRYAFDMALLRVYDQGQPYRPPHFLAWNPAGAKEGDLTLVAGHPGRTLRQDTVAQMIFSRDVALPLRLAASRRVEAALKAFADRSPDHERRVRVQLQSAANTTKRIEGWLQGLRDGEAMARLERHEQTFRSRTGAGPSFQAIEAALKRWRSRYRESQLVSTGDSTLLWHALQLMRLGDELPKPSDQRLPDYQDAYLDDLKERILRRTPIDLEVEDEVIAVQVDLVREHLGARHPFHRALVGSGRVPAFRTALARTTLQDPDVRARLLAGGPKAIRACRDPLLQLLRRIDPHFRELRAWMDREVNASFTEHLARLARARFQQDPGAYPDANGTLRLSFGPVAPFQKGLGRETRPFTTFLGLLDRADGWSGTKAEGNPWALPPRWQARRDRLDKSIPLNFAHAADAVGGSSGSPVVDRAGALLGLLFDGNFANLTGTYYYDGRCNRAISLDARAILEALRKIYDAPHLVEELLAPAEPSQNTPTTLALRLPSPKRRAH